MERLIKRRTKSIAHLFDLEIKERSDKKRYYSIEEKNGKIFLCGESSTSLALAYHAYLKKYCNINFSHCGNTDFEVSFAPLPEKKEVKIIEQEKVVCLNYCTFSYSMRNYDFDDFEKELDLMAMNGVNMPLTPIGNEAVIFYTLLDFGFSKDEALSFISGPAFYPWQMMTNIDSVNPIMDEEYIKERLTLGQRIIKRELELGMTPILQGFAGHAPKTLFEKLNIKNAKQLPSWCGFPGIYSIDPLDESFLIFGKALLEKQKELLGAFHYYACDPFHENEPPVDGKKYLRNVGETISRMYTEFDEKAVWVMQGWSLREEIVKAVDKDKLLILDLDSSKCEAYEGFWGYNYISGTLHNFGDRNTLHGSIKALSKNKYKCLKKKYSNTIGTGLFMEGFLQNPLYYDLAYEMLNESEEIDINSWLKKYGERRYKSSETCVFNYLKILISSCYSENCTGRETGSIICARPSTTYYHTAPNDHTELRYDNQMLLQALKELLSSKNAKGDGFEFDVCDILRQYLSNKAKDIYHKIIENKNKNNREKFEENTAEFENILLLIDKLLSTRKELTLDESIRKAKKKAKTKTQEKLLKESELSLLTIWGPKENNELFDYSWREWSGLIKYFYLPRWQMFFDELRNNFYTDKNISDTPLNHNERNDYDTTDFQKKLKEFELNFIENYEEKSVYNAPDTIELCKEIVESL